MAIEVAVGPPIITINQGSIFMVTNQQGAIDFATQQGLFAGDTRLISFYQIYINGNTWSLLNSSAISYYSARFYFTNSLVLTDNGEIPGGQLGLTLTRTVGEGIHEDIDITSHASKPVSFMLEISIRSDFADIFEVKQIKFVRRGRVTTYWDEVGGELINTYVNKDFKRLMIYRLINSGSPSQYANGRVVFEISLNPGQSWHTCAFFVLGEGDLTRNPLYGCSDSPTVGIIFDQLQTEWCERSTQLNSANDKVTRIFGQSVEDMGALRLYDHDFAPNIWLPAAGVPWFVALFGRDSLIASLQSMIVQASFALGTLKKLAQYQAKEFDDWRDAEPGKILHELRVGELAHFSKIPHTPYYGTADATILYLITLHEAWRWSGDISLLKEYQDVALRCLKWIDHYGDLDGDGFQEYQTRSSSGYENMGWKDSFDSVVYPDGTIVKQPKALCELQGYVFDAKMRMAEVFEALGHAGKANALRQQAQDIQSHFDEAFWMKDENFIAYGLDSQKQQIKTIASNPGHCLWSGIVKPERAGKVVHRLLEGDMWSGWGIRTLSSKNPAFNPFSYQSGSVWPHDNGIIALGFKRYGFSEETNQVANAIFQAAGYFASYRLPELYAGLAQSPGAFPVQYLGANIPQAWAAGSIFHLMQAILGLNADAPKGILHVAPTLPDWLSEVELTDLRVGDSVLCLHFWREAGRSRWEIRDQQGTIRIVDDSLPPPATELG
ncbi:MAG: amylo-alpha-1,6-glucosidase [Chloroflexi bacterium]|nr:amylo-alpha-1,6-glucosidase [Chloroflexota bacterium]